MTYLRCALQLLLLSICCLIVSDVRAAEGQSQASKAKEFLFYRASIPLSPFQSVQVKILQDGFGLVESEGKRYDNSTEKFYPQIVKYSFRLTENELNTLKIRIQEARFFSQQEKNTMGGLDAGQSTMRISLDGKKRQVDYEYLPGMWPLISFLHGLIIQARVLDNLDKLGDTREAYFALSRSFSEEIIQPHAFREPLRKFAQKSNDARKLYWGISALAIIMTDEEWLGFWSTELEGSDRARRTMLLGLLTRGNYPYGEIQGISATKSSILAPVLLGYLEKEYRNWPQMSEAEHDAYYSIILYMELRHHTRATPIFVDMMMRGYELRKLRGEVMPFDILPGTLTNATARMGPTGIHAVEPLLNHSEPRIREYAVNTLNYVLSMDTASVRRNFGPDWGPESILERLKTFLPKLREMAKRDPDATVREAARTSAEGIEVGWRNRTE